MPIISRFFGIVIAIYWRDHGPPHFHAKYGDEEVIVHIETGKTVGRMNRRALALVQEWREARRSELMEDWRLAVQRKPLKQIKPLE